MCFLSFWAKVWAKVFNRNITTTTTSTSTKNVSGNKKAVCIAINDYPGLRNDLRGCVNDAKNWSNLLNKTYGFEITKMLLDNVATKANVIKSLKNLIKGAKAGDSLVVTYSGHGTQVPDLNGDEADGKDEAWVLHDGNLIDDEIKNIISKLPKGVRLTIISDSCHSGTVTRAFLGALDTNGYIKARYMPPEDNVEAFAMGGLPSKKGIFEPRGGMKEILISGCKSTEYSYDANIGGKPTGAFSYYAIQVLKKNPRITYEDFYKELRKSLPSNRFPQTPQLEGAIDTKKAIIFE